jgi:hypothetical protein
MLKADRAKGSKLKAESSMQNKAVNSIFYSVFQNLEPSALSLEQVLRA